MRENHILSMKMLRWMDVLVRVGHGFYTCGGFAIEYYGFAISAAAPGWRIKCLGYKIMGRMGAGEECRDGKIAETRDWGNDFPDCLGRIEGRTSEPRSASRDGTPWPVSTVYTAPVCLSIGRLLIARRVVSASSLGWSAWDDQSLCLDVRKHQLHGLLFGTIDL